MTLVNSIGRVAVATVLAVAGAAVAITTAEPAAAATCTATWAGPAGGDWATAANWSPAAVPTASSVVCIDTAGPVVAAGYNATAQQLQMTGGSLQINGGLRTASFNLRLATLSGAGQLTATTDSDTTKIDGVRVDGTLRLNPGGVVITGQRVMCGGRYSLCLNGRSQLDVTYDIYPEGATVTGNTTAVPAVEASALYLLTSGQTNRFGVDISVGKVVGSQPGNTVQLDRWEQLSADGTLNAPLEPGSNVLVLARTITTLTASTFVDPATVRTTDGLDALRDLTTVSPGAYGRVSLPADITPVSGTLTLQSTSGLSLDSDAPSTVHGAVDNVGVATLFADLRADGAFTSSGRFTVAPDGALTAATATFAGGPLTFVRDGSVTADDGVSIEDVASSMAGCVRFGGDVTMSAPLAAIHARMSRQAPVCPMFSATGSFQLPNTLDLQTSPRVTRGESVVLVEAAGGIQGTFAHIRQPNTRPGHWTITYTATQVVATYGGH